MEILRRYNLYLFLILLGISQQACDSEDAFDCIKKSGEETTVKIDDFPDFAELLIHDDIELEIVETDQEYFELTYGKNLIPKIVMEHENDSLSFFNQNFCGWTRDFEKPKLKWFTNKSSINILCLSNGKITSEDTLRNDFIIRIQDATNEVDLNINNNNTTLLSNSSTYFNVSGKTNGLRIRAYFNDGKYDCGNFIANRANVLQRGYNDIIVNVKDSLIGSIENAGRILYKGNPGVKVEVSNGGELIHLDEE
ncbi:MAG: GIN domain-containing protein [Bacteroidota bacterium]